MEEYMDLCCYRAFAQGLLGGEMIPRWGKARRDCLWSPHVHSHRPELRKWMWAPYSLNGTNSLVVQWLGLCFHCQGQEKKNLNVTSPAVQWLRIHLSVQAQEDSTCLGATKSTSHDDWASTPEPISATREAIAVRSPHLPQLEKSPC